MKAKELIEILKDYEDFEVEAVLSKPDGSKWGFSVTTFVIKGLTDIGHSQKTIILDIENEDGFDINPRRRAYCEICRVFIDADSGERSK